MFDQWIWKGVPFNYYWCRYAKYISKKVNTDSFPISSLTPKPSQLGEVSSTKSKVTSFPPKSRNIDVKIFVYLPTIANMTIMTINSITITNITIYEVAGATWEIWVTWLKSGRFQTCLGWFHSLRRSQELFGKIFNKGIIMLNILPS